MTAPQTPGQIAYEGFWRTISPDFRDPWALLPPSTQARWEAAAQAVLARQTPHTLETRMAFNRWVAERYDTLMREGCDGHYATMFRLVQEALDMGQEGKP